MSRWAATGFVQNYERTPSPGDNLDEPLAMGLLFGVGAALRTVVSQAETRFVTTGGVNGPSIIWTSSSS